MKRLIWTLVIGLVVGMLVGWYSHKAHVAVGMDGGDTTTTTVVDTIPYYYPVPKDSTVTKFIYCKLPVADDTAAWNTAVLDADTAQLFSGAGAGGTPRQCDSATVVVPIEHKVYEDSTYKAWVSGYMVSLDSLHTFNRTITTTIRDREAKPPNRWGIGVTAGYGYGKQGFTPFVGIGITYNLIDLRRGRRQR